MHNIIPCDYAITLFNKLLLDVLGVSFFSLNLLLFFFGIRLDTKTILQQKHHKLLELCRHSVLQVTVVKLRLNDQKQSDISRTLQAEGQTSTMLLWKLCLTVKPA